jgi:hypothetical protein
MKLSKEEVKQVYEQVINRQSYMLTTVGSIAGFSVGLGLFILFAIAGATFAITLFVPAFFVGFGAKFLGNPFEFKYRIIPGVIGMLIYAIGVYFVFTTNPLYLALAPINFVIAYYFSKSKLTKTEENAAWQISMAK